ncbi:MAG: 2-oxo acid dehydrogenase subunit E2 [Chloroflexi bacterium]|nr:2-oxo acid dehydrogenase subunit E2 [Chloroflexota bacterium]
MSTKIVMPQLGESVVEGTVSRWLKREGEAIQEYEPLLEVSTDKVDTEIPSPAAGIVLKIYVPEGKTVERGVLLALIGQPGETLDEGGAAPAAHSEHNGGAAVPASTQPVSANSSYSGHVTPVVARMVAEHGLDLGKIAGSGRAGRITKKDVEAHLASAKNAAPESDLAPWERPGTGDLFKPTVDYGTPAPNAPALAKESIKTAETPRTPAPPAPKPATPGTLVPLTTMRRSIAEHMVQSKLHTSPHVTTVFEVDMSAVQKHRAAHKEAFAKVGVNLTLSAYFAAATVSALQANPYLNAQWTDEGIFLHHAVHLGLAVAMGDDPAANHGLIVPVIRNAQDLNLMGLARAVNDIAERARGKRLQADETRGGTFTISNHGVSGSLFATPIINQPQVGILGVGLVEPRVKVIDGALAVRPCAYVSLTFDHRVADGAAGDAFMATLKQTLESWA